MLEEKLRQVRMTTTLQVLKQYNYTDKWSAIFGRFETRFPPEAAIGGDGRAHGHGFGHMGAAPARLISGPEGHRQLAPDGN
ncbi:MAG TPA: hypothetical protein VGH38_25410 [Bryobacteraceae bacterium]